MSGSKIEGLIYEMDSLELIEDSPWKKVQKVLFFVGTEEIIPIQVELIRILPEVEYIILLSKANGITEEIYRTYFTKDSSLKFKIRFIEFPFPLTDWTQDRIFRFKKKANHKNVLLSSDTFNLENHPWAIYELGVPQFLEQLFPAEFEPLTDKNLYSKKSVKTLNFDGIESKGRKEKDFSEFSFFTPFFGEGGDRLVSDNYMAISRVSYESMEQILRKNYPLKGKEVKPFLERLFQKKIIVLGSSTFDNQFLFHLDVFLTLVEPLGGKKYAILGTPDSLVLEVFDNVEVDKLPDWIDRDYFESDSQKSELNNIKKDLKVNGFEIIEIPLVFLNLSEGPVKLKNAATILTFNNGLLGLIDYQEGYRPTFITTTYVLWDDDMNQMIKKSERVIREKLKKIGLETIFLSGGEHSFKNSGELRCTTGILKRGASDLDLFTRFKLFYLKRF